MTTHTNNYISTVQCYIASHKLPCPESTEWTEGPLHYLHHYIHPSEGRVLWNYQITRHPFLLQASPLSSLSPLEWTNEQPRECKQTRLRKEVNELSKAPVMPALSNAVWRHPAQAMPEQKHPPPPFNFLPMPLHLSTHKHAHAPFRHSYTHRPGGTQWVNQHRFVLCVHAGHTVICYLKQTTQRPPGLGKKLYEGETEDILLHNDVSPRWEQDRVLSSDGAAVHAAELNHIGHLKKSLDTITSR